MSIHVFMPVSQSALPCNMYRTATAAALARLQFRRPAGLGLRAVMHREENGFEIC